MDKHKAVYKVEGDFGDDTKEYGVLTHPIGDTTVYQVVKSQGKGSSDPLLIEVNSYSDEKIATMVAKGYNEAVGEQDPKPTRYRIENVEVL